MKNTIEFIKTHLIETTNSINVYFKCKSTLLHYRPENGGWTIAEILEHISLTSFYLLKLINKSGEKCLKNFHNINFHELAKNYTFENSNLLEIGSHKSFDWIRPEHMEPTRKADLNFVKIDIENQTLDCLHWLDKLADGQGLIYKTQMSVNNIGKIDVYQYIYFLSLHMQRHIQQIEKNKTEYLNKI